MLGDAILLGGMFLNSVVLCALLRPVSYYRVKSTDSDDNEFEMAVQNNQCENAQRLKDSAHEKHKYNWRLWCDAKVSQ